MRGARHKNPSFYKKMPDSAQVAVTDRCNLGCKMCMRKFLYLQYKDMEFSKYTAIVERLPASIKRLHLTGWGEPLLHPRIWDMLSYAKSKRLITSLTTNGTLLDFDNQKKLLNSKLDYLTVSIENVTPRNISTVTHPYSKEAIKNIEALAKLRRNAVPHISLRVALQKNKRQQVFDIVKFAQRVGIEVVYFSRINTAFRKGLRGCSPKEEMRIWRDCVRLKRKEKPTILITPFLYLSLKSFFPIDKFCPKIYNSFYIDVDGEVTPCCNLPNYTIGNILRENLKSLWQSGRFNSFRKNQNKICHTICNLYAYSLPGNPL